MASEALVRLPIPTTILASSHSAFSFLLFLSFSLLGQHVLEGEAYVTDVAQDTLEGQEGKSQWLKQSEGHESETSGSLLGSSEL